MEKNYQKDLLDGLLQWFEAKHCYTSSNPGGWWRFFDPRRLFLFPLHSIFFMLTPNKVYNSDFQRLLFTCLHAINTWSATQLSWRDSPLMTSTLGSLARIPKASDDVTSWSKIRPSCFHILDLDLNEELSLFYRSSTIELNHPCISFLRTTQKQIVIGISHESKR